MFLPAALAALLGLGGCATAPINPPITHADPTAGYRYQTRAHYFHDKDDIVVLAFSGGGTRAAAFSYGVLEVLRGTEVIGPKGDRFRLLDSVHVVTGVSGGSFTALAYGLYGDRLFSEYEQRFLKRDVQGELIGRLLNPFYWGPLNSPEWGRSELAADIYDEILFNGATFADLQRGSGPMILASATDLSSGARFYYTQQMFDILCSDLGAVRLSRAAASSSGVPVVLSPVTIHNYGGSCGYRSRRSSRASSSAAVARPAARTIQQIKELRYYEDGKQRPYLHLVDGGVSDNLGMRGILETWRSSKRFAWRACPRRSTRRAGSPCSSSTRCPRRRSTGIGKRALRGLWRSCCRRPGCRSTIIRTKRSSFCATPRRGGRCCAASAIRGHRRQRKSGVGRGDESPEPRGLRHRRIIAELKDSTERAYLNELPTSFVLPAEAVDRLRAAAGTIVLDSPDFQRYLKDMGERIVKTPTPAGKPAPLP
jgi:NTE family protein